MNCFVKHIAVIDKTGKQHPVSFSKGVNIITGASSTGKSAMIEIFDYCFGSSEFNIPEGVITENSEWYIVVMNFEKSSLLLARKGDNAKPVLREESLSFTNEINNITTNYLDSCDTLFITEFRKKLSNCFGIQIIDTDTNKSDRLYRGNKEKPRPSIRNGVSYLLQHQNLIANKHALFYRFDQKEKREQTIDQFKIFAGLVDQEYYAKEQEISELKEDKNSLEKKLKNNIILLEVFSKKAELYVGEYESITGVDISDKWNLDIISEPKRTLQVLKGKQIEIDYASDKHNSKVTDLEIERDKAYRIVRNLESRIRKIDSSIKYANSFKVSMSSLEQEDSHPTISCKCPICNTSTTTLKDPHKKLSNAIDWLNNELEKTRVTVDNYHREKKELQRELKEARLYLDGIKEHYEAELKLDKLLEERNGLEKQAQKTLWKIESHLEEQVDLNFDDIEQEIKNIDKSIRSKQKILRKEYNVEKLLKEAKNIIEEYMNELKNSFEFEREYTKGKFRFELNSFDLYFEKDDGKKIYLRSMGSGANWLYTHLSLFLGLQYYFCSRGESSSLPSTLFLDQPSQVYFPSTEEDKTEIFDKSKLRKNSDIDIVTDLFDSIVSHCNKTEKDTNILPQVIITEHADNLKLKNAKFDDLVNNRRWRDRGFIHPIPEESTND